MEEGNKELFELTFKKRKPLSPEQKKLAKRTFRMRELGKKIDDLTGLLNTKGLEHMVKIIQHELDEENIPVEQKHRSQEKSKVVGVVLYDLDYLHEINKKYGFKAGDLYLEAMAKASEYATQRKEDITAHLIEDENDKDIINKRKDFSARLGGQADEFSMVLPGADKDGTEVVIVRTRTKLKELEEQISDTYPGIKFGFTAIYTTCKPGDNIMQKIYDTRDVLAQKKAEIRERGSNIPDAYI